jgi:hypothetical protein
MRHMKYDSTDPMTWTPWQREYFRARGQLGVRNHREFWVGEWLAARWVHFANIAEWCGRVPGDIMPSAERRAQAYHLLAESVLAAEFNDWETGRPAIALMPVRWDHRPRLRLDVGEFRWWCDQRAPDDVLARCWAPREACARWFAGLLHRRGWHPSHRGCRLSRPHLLHGLLVAGRRIFATL